VNDPQKMLLSVAILDLTTQQNLGKRENAGQWRAYFMIQDRHDFAVELQWKQQPAAGHANRAVDYRGMLGRCRSSMIDAVPAQFPIPGATLIVRDAMPDDDFHVIGRNIASPHVTGVNALPVERANPLAIHVRSIPCC